MEKKSNYYLKYHKPVIVELGKTAIHLRFTSNSAEPEEKKKITTTTKLPPTISEYPVLKRRMPTTAEENVAATNSKKGKKVAGADEEKEKIEKQEKEKYEKEKEDEKQKVEKQEKEKDEKKKNEKVDEKKPGNEHQLQFDDFSDILYEDTSQLSSDMAGSETDEQKSPPKKSTTQQLQNKTTKSAVDNGSHSSKTKDIYTKPTFKSIALRIKTAKERKESISYSEEELQLLLTEREAQAYKNKKITLDMALQEQQKICM